MTTPTQTRTLEQIRESIAKPQRGYGNTKEFRVFVQHQAMPIPMSVAGPASASRADATDRARESLTNPTFTQAWTIGADGVQEVTL